MEMDEKRLLEKYIYLETNYVLSKLEIEKNDALLKIDYLEKAILRKKYIVGDSSISSEDARKVESISPSYKYERDHLSETRKNIYLIEIAEKEAELQKERDRLAFLEAQIKASKKKIEDYKKGILPGKDLGGDLGPGLDDEEDKDKDKDDDRVVLPTEPKDEDDKDDEKVVLPPEPEDKDEKGLKDEVVDVVEPKKSIWKRIGRIAIMAASLLGLLAIGKGCLPDMNKDNTNNNTPDESTHEDSEQEDIDLTPLRPVIPDVTPAQPISPEIPVGPFETPAPTVEPTATPAPTAEPTATPAPTATPVVTPEPYVPIQLVPGEAAVNLDDEVEVTRDGTIRDYGNGTPGHADLDQNPSGTVTVSEDDLKPVVTPTPLPPTGDERDYDEVIDALPPGEAGAINEAMGDFDWDSALAEQAAALTLH